MIPILWLTRIYISACSLLNDMEITKSIVTSNLQSFKVKLCAVAIRG